MSLISMAVGCAGGPRIEGGGIGTMAEDGRYRLSAEEMKLDCSRLRGRISIRIMQVRSRRETSPGSAVAQAVHRTMQPITGGTTHGARPDDDMLRDMAQITAYNERLAALKCPKIDVAGELAASPAR